ESGLAVPISQAARFRPRGRDGDAAEAIDADWRFCGVRGLPCRRLSIRETHRRARQSHCALSDCGGMLVRADELDGGLETSAAVGTNDPRLPALALFLQYLEQRDALARTGPRFQSFSTGGALC